VTLSPADTASPTPSSPEATPFPAIRGSAVAVLTTQTALVSVGDRILRSSDGGVTWRVVRDGPIASEVYIRDLQWVGDIAFAASTRGLFRSGPLGSGWQSVSTRSDLQRLDFLTQTLGYAISDPNPHGGGTVLLRTSDGGQSFEPVDPGLAPVQWVQFVSAQLGWAAGPLGIAVTRDGGVHWTRQLTFPATVFDAGSPDYPAAWTSQVGFRDPLHGFAYYRTRGTVMNQSAGVVYYTADGGRTWQGKACTCGYIPIPPDVLLGAKPTLPGGVASELDVTGTLSASIVSADGVMNRTEICTTFSAGAEWSCSPLPFVIFAPGRMASLGATRWLVLTVIANAEAVIATSVDSGASWTARTTVTAR
jgi:photosystem II stability/assembly factor-like uncharacterized protein